MHGSAPRIKKKSSRVGKKTAAATRKKKNGGFFAQQTTDDSLFKKIILFTAVVTVALGLAYMAISGGFGFATLCACAMSLQNVIKTVTLSFSSIGLVEGIVNNINGWLNNLLLQRSTGEALMLFMLTLFTQGCCRQENSATPLLSSCNGLKLSAVSTSVAAAYTSAAQFLSPAEIVEKFKQAISLTFNFIKNQLPPNIASLFSSGSIFNAGKMLFGGFTVAAIASMQIATLADDAIVALLKSDTLFNFIKYAADNIGKPASPKTMPQLTLNKDNDVEWAALTNDNATQTAIQRMNRGCGFVQTIRRNGPFLAFGVAAVAISLAVLSQFSAAAIAYSAGGVMLSRYGVTLGASMLYRAISTVGIVTSNQVENVRLVIYGVFCTVALCACCLLERNVDLHGTIFADMLRQQLLTCGNKTKKTTAAAATATINSPQITSKHLMRDLIAKVARKLRIALRNKAKLAVQFIRLGELIADTVIQGGANAFFSSDISRTSMNIFMGLAGQSVVVEKPPIPAGARFLPSICQQRNLHNAMIIIRAWITKLFCNSLAESLAAGSATDASSHSKQNTLQEQILNGALEHALDQASKHALSHKVHNIVQNIITEEVMRLRSVESAPQHLASLQRTAAIVLSDNTLAQGFNINNAKDNQLLGSIRHGTLKILPFHNPELTEVLCNYRDEYTFRCFANMELNIYQRAVLANFTSVVEAGTAQSEIYPPPSFAFFT